VNFGFSLSEPRYKVEVSGKPHAPDAFRPGKQPGNHWIRGCVDATGGLEVSRKS